MPITQFSFHEFLKTWKSYILAVDPGHWSQYRHAQNCDVDSGTREFRRDSSCLFYLCKFSFVVHTKCREKVFWMDYEANSTKLKQARWFKPDVTCSWIYVTTYSKPRENWCERWTKWTAKFSKADNKLRLILIQFFFWQMFVL